jgi:hypothetical protein
LRIPLQSEIHSAYRLTAPFEATPEPTTLGGYMTLICGVLMSIALFETDGLRKAGAGALAVLSMVPLVYTFSRTTYLACLGMVLLLGVIARRYWLILLSLFGLFLLAAFGPQMVIDRVASTFDESRELGLDASAWERVYVWSKVRHNLGEYPLLGRGFPHPILDSQFARILIESGLLGFLAWCAVLVSCARMGLRLRGNASTPLHRAVAVGYLVGIGALVIHALATITFYIVRIMMPFWLLTGIVAFLDAWERERRVAPADAI